jgi:hypothetical protein
MGTINIDTNIAAIATGQPRDAAPIANSLTTLQTLVNGNLDAANLAADSVGASELAAEAVETANIKPLNVTTGCLADLGVTSGKLAANAATPDKLSTTQMQFVKLTAKEAVGGTLGQIGAGQFQFTVNLAYNTRVFVSGILQVDGSSLARTENDCQLFASIRKNIGGTRTTSNSFKQDLLVGDWEAVPFMGAIDVVANESTIIEVWASGTNEAFDIDPASVMTISVMPR